MEQKNTLTQPWILCTTGAYLVLAGPGTGKTFTVIHRIENLVKYEHVEPSKILCLTFSNAAAKEMLDRLKTDVDIEGVNVFTFHGLCLDIIKNYRSHFNLPENYSLINDALKNDLMRQCLTEKEPEYWISSSGNTFYFIDELLGAVSEIKRNRLTKERYFDNIEENPDFMDALIEAKAVRDAKQTKSSQAEVERLEKKIGRAKEAWEYYEMYNAKMEEYGLIDFDDCISLVLDAFNKKPELLKEIASKYQFLMVDEYQDTNVSQNELVIKMGKIMGNVFAVGDDDQMIYRFQGANINSISNYITAFKETLTTYCLQDNYRSSQKILDAAEIMANEDSVARVINNPEFKDKNISKKLTAVKVKKDNDVCLNIFSNALQERKAVVSDIQKLVNSNACEKKEIAILVRTNEEASKYAQLLTQVNIPSEVKKGMDLFEVEGVNLLLCYLKAIAFPKRYRGSVFYMLHSKPFSLCPEDFYYLWSKDKEDGKKGNTFEILEKGCKEGQIKEKDKVENIYLVYKALKGKKFDTISSLIKEVGEKTGILDYYNSLVDKDTTQAGLELLQNIADGYFNVYGKNDVFSFLTYLEKLQDYGVSLPVEKPKTGATDDAIQVITYHASKGREFAYVFMPNLTNKGYEDKRDKQTKLPITEFSDGGKEGRKKAERIDNVKLLFVGMTRARHTLNLSYALKNEKDKDTEFTELLKNLKKTIKTNDRTAEVYESGEVKEKDYVKELFNYEKDYKDLTAKYIEEIPNFSATNLNNYLSCPAKYFLERIIRLQDDGDNKASGYGSAVHEACEHLVKKAIENGAYPSYKEFKEVFDAEITKRFYDEDLKNELLKKGDEKLPDFYNYLLTRPVKELFAAELTYEPMFEGKPFITKIDRIEKTADGNYQIYDYKTGKPKDSDVICWNGDHEDYLRQLGMYSYIFEQGNPGCKVTQTGFIFPDGAQNGENDFILSYKPEDIERIVNDYKKAIADINNMKFEPCKEGSKACNYCAFRTTVCKREKAGF